MENKPKSNKTFLQVKDQAKLASDDIIDNTPAPPKIFRPPTEAQVTDLFDESVTKSRNSKHTPEIQERNFQDITTAAKQINTLEKEMAALKKFISEQLHVVEKSIDDLKNKQQTPKNLHLF